MRASSAAREKFDLLYWLDGRRRGESGQSGRVTADNKMDARTISVSARHDSGSLCVAAFARPELEAK